MNLGYIRELGESYAGGLKKLSADIGMSEANLHRCINLNRIQASDLEEIAIKLNVDISVFFDEAALKFTSRNSTNTNEELVKICKLLVANFQQRDKVVSQLVSMVKRLEK